MIVTEVEFVPLYVDQPLYGDISSFLINQGFMFHKFLDLQGRAMIPTVFQNNPAFPSTHMWADAVFINDVTKLQDCTDEKLLKGAILSHLYDSIDISYHLLAEIDKRNETNHATNYATVNNRG